MAAVFCASFRRRAMVWRRRVILTRSSRAASSAGTGARGMAPACAGASWAGAMGADGATAAATSSFITRPSLPVGVTASREMPASVMAFLAEGASSTSRGTVGSGPAMGASEGSLTVEGTPSNAFVTLSFSFGAAVATAPSVICASRALAATVVPSAATISARTPATGEGTSRETLSVSNSHRISSTATASPTFLNQVATVASVTLSPRAGTRTSVVMISFL